MNSKSIPASPGIGSWFRGVRGKLLLMNAIPTLIIGVLLGISSRTVTQLVAELTQADTVTTPALIDLLTMDRALNGAARWMWATYVNHERAEREQTLASGRKQLEEFKAHLENYRKSSHSPEIQAQASLIDQHWEQAQSAAREVFELMSKHTPTDNESARQKLTNSFRPETGVIAKAISEIIAYEEHAAEVETKQSLAGAAHDQKVMQASGAIGVLALLFIGFWISSHLAKILARVTSEISEAGEQVRSGSSQLSAASQQVSSGSTEAASALEETVASVEELSSMVKLNADNAKQAATLAQSSSVSAENGESQIHDLIASMTQIATSSKKIEDIINVIDDIAFQTNLLALNAAVEAARAGEQGKGFAVVAEAVRSLAQRSASAAKDITVLIQESVSQIEKGSRTADQSGAVLKGIVVQVKKVADLNQEIASASIEQANGIGQISKAMNELDTSTQANASASEEVAASAEEMSSQADLLRSLVGELSVVVDGRSTRAETSSRAAPAASRSTPSIRSRPHTEALAQPRAQVNRPSKTPPHRGQPKLVAHPGGKSKSAVSAPSSGAATIPFDDSPTTGLGKVGTTEGF